MTQLVRDAEGAKADLIGRAAEAVGKVRGPHLGDWDDQVAGGEEERLTAFLTSYYRHVPAEDLVGRDSIDIAGAALSHRQLAARRPPGRAVVRVFTPTVEEHGWSTGHTVVEVVTDDMPFLVDSVTAELTRQGRGIHLVIHPQLRVRRELPGALLEVVLPGPAPTATPPPDEAAGDVLLESWIHVEIDRETEPADLERIGTDLRRVLHDVRDAVEDWAKMREQALRIAAETRDHPPRGLPTSEVDDTQELLCWLADEHFTFLGYREYVLAEEDGEEVLRAIPGTGLGILRSDRPHAGRLSPEARAKAREPKLLVLTEANTRSTVHRPAYLDYVGVKAFDAEGRVVGERRFLGLLTSAAYNESVLRIPVLRRKATAVLERSGFTPTSHSGKDLVQVLETYPRDELFQVSVEDLVSIALSVLHLQERRQLRLFLRRDDYGRFISALVYLPRDRYTTDIRLRMEQILREAFAARSVDYTARVYESVLARLHFVVRTPPGQTVPDVDPTDLERRLTEATRSWTDDFAEALVAQAGEEEASRLLRAYPDAFPEAYKEDFPARSGVADLRRIDELGVDGALVMSLYAPYGARPGERRFKLFRTSPVSLSQVLPMLQRMGVEVTDERPYELTRGDGTRAWIYDFGLRHEPWADVAEDRVETLFQDAFAAVWTGAAESDGFNALVLSAGLTWRQAMVLRAYAKYLRQTGTTFSQDYIETCLLANVGIAVLLTRLFETRFDPARGDDSVGSGRREEDAGRIVEEIRSALDAVASLDQDRILRAYLTLMAATTRTNYFQTGGAGPKPYLSVKLDSRAIPELPRPHPRFEIWVYSPLVEGVHLRFGPVARGGLRWSDRREDFRTEVLGLVKAQMVKNAVIVPVGAKGGFVVKRPPADPTDRDAVLAEGVACYQLFVRGLLDVTDNLVDGRIEPPADVVRHDGDDAYLVVAADKGTASFSDVANRIAHDYGFWLGDAFASGGSAGYDHKAMGITARGAWESVRRHFRELGHDPQTEDFTVVGVGDMSGDVFGNGMLLSEHIRLVAAFDHRHLFLDPDPDAATSYAERRRLFDLPRSSWADYDRARISPGGGVYPRTAKSVPVSPQVRDRLGLDDAVTSLTPADLIRAILTAPVDLFWNGGIGTYVKAFTESAADVGDKANDAVRVDGAQVRARVIGEGGNLGCTQLGRIEYALAGCGGAGGRVNTDAIDNSAGVDTSDHEVNLKILLDRLVRDGELTGEQRDALLADMTDEVARLVLRDNHEQNVVLGVARAQAPAMLSVHARLLRHLEQHGLDRTLEFLPDDEVIRARAAAGQGLTSPELSVLLAYVKITLTAQLLASDLPDGAWFARVLRGYFPKLVVERYGDRLDDHPLRREIITTFVVNDMVNRCGTTFAFRVQEETGAAPAQIARAYTVAREVFGFSQYWAAVEALDAGVPSRAQTALHLEGRRLMDRTVRWLLQSRRSLLDVTSEVERFRPGVVALAPRIPQFLRGAERDRLRSRAGEFEKLGAPGDLALVAAGLLDAFSLLDIISIADDSGLPAEDVAQLYFALSERFAVDALLTRITALPRGDRWQALARSALRYDLYAALGDLTSAVLTSAVLTSAAPTAVGGPSAAVGGPEALIDAWERRNAEGLARARATLADLQAGDTWDLAALSVALRVFRTLVRT